MEENNSKLEKFEKLESEAGIIASLICNPTLYFYSEELLPNHFTNKENRLVYHAITELATRGIETIDAYNILEILDSKESTKRYSEILTIDKLQELVEMSSILARGSSEEYKLLVQNVLGASFRRDIYNKLIQCEQMVLDESKGDIERKIYEAIDSVMMDYSLTSEMPLYKDEIDEIWEQVKARQQGKTEAIEFPFPLLNEYVVMEPGETICFTGAAKAGKSAMLLTCAVDLLKKGKSVLYIDSEISTKLFTIRLLSHLTDIPFGNIRSGVYTEEQEERISKAVEWIKTKNFIHLYTPVLDGNAMYLAAKKAKHLIDIDVVIVDYLKANSSKDDAYQVYADLGNVSDTLKNKIAGEMQIRSLTAAQATATGKIADSARIARSMSTVIAIQDNEDWDETDEEQTGSRKRLKVVYNRNGAQMTDGEYIDMSFTGSTVKYRQATTQSTNLTPF